MTINLGVGARLPAHASSMGKVLLAHLSPTALDAYFEHASLQRQTPRTISDESTLRNVLRTVRARGWASSDEESEAGVRSVAAALFDRTNHVPAAMSIAGHSSRVSMDELHHEHLPILIDAALQVSRVLGADVSTPRWDLGLRPTPAGRLAGKARTLGR
jgi:IclR family pca regulon transcriptional regulator